VRGGGNFCTGSLEKADKFRKIGDGRMRLVRDDDYMDVMEEQQEPQPQAETTPSSKKRSRKRAAIAEDDATTSEAPDTEAASAEAAEATEAPDGAVQDSSDSESDSDDSAAAGDVQIDLRTLEALLFSTHHPLTAGRLAEMLELESTKPIRRAIKELNEQYVGGDRSFRVEQVAGGYQLLTLPEFGEVLKKLHQREVDAKLTKAALETLAIIAYKQPILRVDIEAIRGVACGETIRNLMEKHLVKIAGRAEVPGRPILYGTTRRFLELFGLNSTKDLPQSEQTLANANPPSTS
jgi:segregation and condensation protein B